MHTRLALALLALSPAAAWAADQGSWALHGQATVIEQYHPAFRAGYSGPNSMDPGSRGNETVNATLYAGARLWEGGEAWANLEMDQGFGLSNTLGIAAFPNGQGSKVGKAEPYLRLQRLFVRQDFDLGGEAGTVAPDANQLGGSRAADNLVITAGKFSAVDIFDTNRYAHDPMRDFLNWGIIDAGPYDYAADAWGYSYGAAAEWSFAAWTLRAGLFNLSRVSNGTELTRGFGQYQLDGEIERRITLWGRDGKVKLLGFASRGRLGSYADAVAAPARPADIAAVRRGAWKPGLSLNVEQALTDGLGVFLRTAFTDGSHEGNEFTDMGRSIAAGLSLKGDAWGRNDDTVGLAFNMGGISRSARRFFDAGGLGILIGDGKLTHYGNEYVLETYYAFALGKDMNMTLDYQFIANPAYNTGRGPVSVLGLRLHGGF